MTLKNKLIVSFGTMILLFTVLTSVVFFKMSKMRTQFTLVMEQDTPVVANAHQLLKLVIDMETGQRGFCITQDEKFLDPYHEAIAEFDVLLTREIQLVSDHPSQVEALQHIDALLKQWHESAAGPEIAAARKSSASKGIEESSRNHFTMVALFKEGSGKALIDEIREAFAQFIQVENQHMVQRFSEASQTMRSAHKVIAFGLGFTVLFGSVIAVWVTRGLIASVTNLLKGTAVIGSGNLDYQIEVLSHDEMGTLTEAFNKMVTRLQDANDLTRESRARYKLLSDVALEGVGIHIDGKVIDANKNFCTMFGYTFDEFLHLGDYLLFPQSQRNRVRQKVQTGYESPYETMGVKKDGTEFPIMIQAKAMQIGDQKCRVASVRDLTLEKQMEREIEGFRETVLQNHRYAYVNSIGSVVAHQLNQPLSSLNLNLGQLKEDLQTGEANASSVIDVINNCLRESGSAAEMMRQFRKSIHQSSLESRTFINIQTVAEKMVSALAIRSNPAQMEFQLQGLDALPEILISETALEQIFFNLAQNAIDASDKQKPNRLTIAGQCQDGNVILTFRDDCGGVRAGDEERVFDAFFSTKKPSHGLGLGLEIVCRILMMNGGTITLNNQPGTGAEFVVKLPIE